MQEIVLATKFQKWKLAYELYSPWHIDLLFFSLLTMKLNVIVLEMQMVTWNQGTKVMRLFEFSLMFINNFDI